MDLTIAINGYRNPELLKLCIKSIRRNVKNVNYELIVTDSATEEETELMMREEFPGIKFFPSRINIGFQGMVKKSIEQSQGEYLLLLNNDIIVRENSVEAILEFMKKNPDVGIAGPQLLNFNDTLQYSCFRFYKPITILYRRTFLGKFSFAKKHLDWFLMKDYDHETIRDVDWLMGSCLMLKAAAVSQVGGMDERFFLYFEDVDWCRRMWEAAWRVVYLPPSEFSHYYQRSSQQGGVTGILTNRVTREHLKSAIKYFWKYRGKELPL